MKKLTLIGYALLALMAAACTLRDGGGATGTPTATVGSNAMAGANIALLAELREAAKTLPYNRVEVETTHLDGSGLVTTEKGLVIYAPAGAVRTADGKTYTGEYDVHIRQATTLDEFMRFGLTTRSDKGQLTSGGMFEVTLTDPAGKPLQIDPNVGFKVSAPVCASGVMFRQTAASAPQTDWRIFQADQTPEGDLLWREAAEKPKPTTKLTEANVRDYAQIEAFLAHVELLREYRSGSFQSMMENNDMSKNKLGRLFFDAPGLKLSKDLCKSLGLKVPAQTILPLGFVGDKLYGARVDGARMEGQNLGCQILPEVFNNRMFPKTGGNGSFNYGNGSGYNYDQACDITAIFDAATALYRRQSVEKPLLEAAAVWAERDRQMARLTRVTFTVLRTGWCNIDRYVGLPELQCNFTLSGIDPAVRPYVQIAWVQPNINSNLRPTAPKNGGDKYAFRSANVGSAFLYAWIEGHAVALRRFTQAEIKECNGNLGEIQMQPAESGTVDEQLQGLYKRAM